MAKVYTKEELNSFSRETLMAVILSMQDQISQLNTNMERLIEQIADANNKRYGRSSEKLETISGQMELELIFNEAEALTETLYVVEPAEEDVIQPRHRKSKGKREADLKDLPVEVISHTLSEEKLRDVFGTDGWKQLPDEIYKRVRVQPAVYTVEEHHVAVYAGRDNQTIIKADRPKDLLRNSLLTPSLAASIMNAKYVNGLPLYRISQEFLRNDIHISRQVMANWMIQCADRYLGILYDRLHRELYQFHVLQADETPVMVTKDGRPVNSKSYMWIYRTGKSYTDRNTLLCKISASWIGFSVLLLCVLGWGTSSNALFLYALYFSWAFWTPLFLSFQKIYNKGYKKSVIVILTCLFILMAKCNVAEFIRMLNFAVENYPL